MSVSSRMLYRGPGGAVAEYICMANDGETGEAFAVYYPAKFIGNGVIEKTAAMLVTLARWEREWTAMSEDEIKGAAA